MKRSFLWGYLVCLGIKFIYLYLHMYCHPLFNVDFEKTQKENHVNMKYKLALIAMELSILNLK